MSDKYNEAVDRVYDLIEQVGGKEYLTPDLRNQQAMGIVDEILELYGIEKNNG